MTLDDVQADAFRLWSRGVADRRSPFRSPTLGTMGLDGRARLRTVVLRGFDPEARRLVVHSDVRAGKIAEIGRDARVMLHVWDAGGQVQVQAAGTAVVQTGAAARAEWDGLHPGSRATYRVRVTPGTALDDPAVADADQVDEDAAFANFALIGVQMTGLEWLYLGKDGHRRAAFVWTGASLDAHWLVP